MTQSRIYSLTTFDLSQWPSWLLSLLSAGTVLLYIAFFLAMVGELGRVVAAMATIPVVVIGCVYGMRLGLLAGILTIPLNMALLSITGQSGWDIVMRVPSLASHSVFLIIGATVGRLRDLGEQVRLELVERKRIEQQLIQAQKMEAVGRLAGGVAHDFSNLLTVINGHTEIMMKGIDARHPMYENLAEIMLAGDQAALLTRQLLAFSRRQQMEPQEFDLNVLIGDMRQILQSLAGSNVELLLDLPPALGQVRVDPVQIQQVLMNLTVNARDAMPGGGKLTIKTASVEVSEAVVRRHGIEGGGRYIRLSVYDTGVGMDSEIQSHMYEPFFTTKQDNQGTGLGLATVYGIVSQSNGFIECESAPDKGAAFHIHLPQIDPSAESVATETAGVR